MNVNIGLFVEKLTCKCCEDSDEDEYVDEFQEELYNRNDVPIIATAAPLTPFEGMYESSNIAKSENYMVVPLENGDIVFSFVDPRKESVLQRVIQYCHFKLDDDSKVHYQNYTAPEDIVGNSIENVFCDESIYDFFGALFRQTLRGRYLRMIFQWVFDGTSLRRLIKTIPITEPSEDQKIERITGAMMIICPIPQKYELIRVLDFCVGKKTKKNAVTIDYKDKNTNDATNSEMVTVANNDDDDDNDDDNDDIVDVGARDVGARDVNTLHRKRHSGIIGSKDNVIMTNPGNLGM
jgi:hypothetical protein